MAIQNRRGADADFDPNKVLPGEFGFTTDGSRKVYAAFAPNDVKEVAFKEDVPAKTSDLANDTGFVTKTVADLINYYTKSETYTQEEINQLVSTIPKFSIQPVPELPTEKISTTTVYLLTTGEESENLYTEYIYVNGAWEKLGTQKLDLSGYALKTDIPTKLSELINDTEFITAAVDNLVNYYTKKEMEERLYEKANSIISTRTGTVVATTDSAKAKPKNIKLFGKTEQPSTEGNQLITYPYADSSKTLNGINFIDNGDGSITVKGTATAYCFFSMTDDDVALATGTYTISGYVDGVKIIVQNKNDNTYLRNTFTLAENATVGIWLDISIGVSLDVTIYPMLNAGDTALPWEPYTGGEASPNMNYPQPLNSHGDSGSIEQTIYDNNLIPYPYSDGSNITVNGVTFTEKNGVITASGTPTTVVTDYNLFGEDKNNGKYLFIPKGNYNYSYSNDSFEHENTFIGFRTVEKGALLGLKTIVKALADMDLHIYNIFVRCGNITETYNLSVSPVLTLDNSTEFIPRSETQTLTNLTPNGLRGIPLGQTIPDAIKNSPIHMAGVYWDNIKGQYYIGDTVEFESGKYVQRIFELLIDDTSGVFDYAYPLEDTNIFGVIVDGITQNAPILCNRLIDWTNWGIARNGIHTNANNRIVFRLKDELSGITSEDSSSQKVTKVNALLAEKPLVVQYYLINKVITTDLTEEELDQYNATLMNYPNTTVVNDAGAYMEVEYVADTKEHIKQNYVAKSEHEALKERVSEIENVIANL